MKAALLAPGRPVPAHVRAQLEPKLGQSFSDVRVHDDGAAADSARALGAQGYAFGRHVVIGAGLDVAARTEVMAHELAHAAQAVGEQPSAVTMATGTDEYEQEASAAASSVVAGRSAHVRLQRSSRLRRQVERPAQQAAAQPTLDNGEYLLVWGWLSRWQIDPEVDSRLVRRLGANHDENVERIAIALHRRRLERQGRADPRLLLPRAGEELTAEARALRDGPVRDMYEHQIHLAEQRLEPGEQAVVETMVGTTGTAGPPGTPRLTGDAEADTAALAQAILCGRIGMLLGGNIDPLFCADAQVTRASPIFAAFRATVIRPLYQELRSRPGRALAEAMEERRLGAGEHAGQIRQIAATGVVRSRGTTVVPSLGLLRMLEALASESTPRERGTPDFEIVSLVRPGAGPHGALGPSGVGLARAVDIVRFAGANIDITQPESSVRAIAAVIRALPPGCYLLGLPRPPRTDPEGGAEDAQNHQRFYRASTGPTDRPVLSERGQRAIATNPFLPAVNLRHCPTGSLRGDLARLGPGGQAELTAAADEAQARGARILCLFPDGPDHLHVQVEQCRPERAGR